MFTLSLIWAVDYLAGIFISTHVHQNCPKTKNIGEFDDKRKLMRPRYREETIQWYPYVKYDEQNVPNLICIKCEFRGQIS